MTHPLVVVLRYTGALLLPVILRLFGAKSFLPRNHRFLGRKLIVSKRVSQNTLKVCQNTHEKVNCYIVANIYLFLLSFLTIQKDTFIDVLNLQCCASRGWNGLYIWSICSCCRSNSSFHRHCPSCSITLCSSSIPTTCIQLLMDFLILIML